MLGAAWEKRSERHRRRAAACSCQQFSRPVIPHKARGTEGRHQFLIWRAGSPPEIDHGSLDYRAVLITEMIRRMVLPRGEGRPYVAEIGEWLREPILVRSCRTYLPVLSQPARVLFPALTSCRSSLLIQSTTFRTCMMTSSGDHTRSKSGTIGAAVTAARRVTSFRVKGTKRISCTTV